MLLAQNLDAIEQKGLGLNLSKTPADWITKFLPYLLSISGIALLIYIVIGGLQLMTSRGDPKGVAAAQAKITYAVVGFVVIILAYSFTQLAGNIFGVATFLDIFK